MIRHCICLLFAMVISVYDVDAQRQRVVDSLQAVLASRTGIERFWALYDLAFEYIQKDNQKAMKYIDEAAKLALTSGDTLWIVKSTRVRGQILYLTGRHQEVVLTLTSLTQYPNLLEFDKEYFEVMSTLGASYLFMSQFDQALAVFFQAYIAAKRTDAHAPMSVALTNIGLVYYKLKDYERAIHYLKASLADTHANGTIELNISLCYSYLGHLDEARASLQRAAEQCKGDCSNVYRMHMQYADAHILFRAGRFQEAELCFRESLRLAIEAADIRMQLDNLYELSRISVQASEFTKAESLLSRAVQIIEDSTPFNMEKVKVYEQMSSLYLSRKDFVKAASYQSKYIDLKDSIYNEGLMTSLMGVESKYLEHENESKIAEQAKVIVLNREIIKHQERLNLLLFIVAGLTVVIIIVLIENYRKKQTLNILLERRVKERTKELEMNRHELLEKSRQQELLLGRVFSGLHEKMSTLRGLCFTARAEVSDPMAQEYIGRIDWASADVDQFVRSVLGNSLRK